MYISWCIQIHNELNNLKMSVDSNNWYWVGPESWQRRNHPYLSNPCMRNIDLGSRMKMTIMFNYKGKAIAHTTQDRCGRYFTCNRQQQDNYGVAVQPLDQHATWKNRNSLYQFQSGQSNTQSLCGSTTIKKKNL